MDADSQPVLVPDAAIEADAIPETRRWNLATRIAFRFACCYLLLYPLSAGMWSSITPWVVVRVFHLSVPATVSRSGGSGDTALGYAERFCILAAAVSAAILWSVLDRRRKNYHELHLWLRIYLRYLLAFVLFSYGFVKIFPLQMPPPTFARLIEPYGEFSPMGVLWSFIGVSTAYSFFPAPLKSWEGCFWSSAERPCWVRWFHSASC